MRCTLGSFVVLLLITLSTLTFFSFSALAEVATIDVHLDLDQNSATGCTVTTADGDAPGVELRIRTLFDVTTGMVTETTTAPCEDALLGVFGVESAVSSAPALPYGTVAGNGLAGSTLIESHVPVAVAGAARSARAFVAVTSIVGEDALLAGSQCPQSILDLLL